MLHREARSRTTTSSSWQDVIATSPSQASTSSTSLKSIDALTSHSSPSSPGILSLSSADVTNSRRSSLAPPIGLDVVIDEEHLNPKRPTLVSTPPSPTSSSGGSSTSSKRNASSAFASPTTSSAKRQRLPSIEIGFGPEPPSPFSSPPAAPRSKFSSSSSSSTSPSDPKRAYFQNLVKDIGARGYSTMGAQDREQLLMAKLASQFADFTAQIEAGQQREKELRSRAMVVLGQRDHARAKLAEAEERLEVERRGASSGSRNRQYQQTAPGGMTPLGMVTTAMKSQQHQQQWLPPRSLSASSLHGLP